MKEVTKEEFFKSFMNLNVTTGCPVSYKIWEVRFRNSNELIAKSVETEDGEKFYIKTLPVS